MSPAEYSTSDTALLRAIVNTAGSVILGLHPDNRIFEWNGAAEQLYQTPREQALGMDYVSTFIAPEHQAAVRADIIEVLAGKLTLNFEDDSILPDGQRRTLIWNVSRVLDTHGTPVGVVATGQDITERKEAEERFRLVFEHAQDGLLISDDSGVVDCNPAALQMLGLTERHQLIGRRPAEFSPPFQPDGQASEEKSRAIGAVTRRHGAHTFDWMHQRPDGTPVPVEISVQHTLLNGRRVSVVSWRDQTRRLELDRERALMQQRLDLAQKMEAVGQLAGGVAHDFNNLLAAIRNAVQLALYEIPEGTAARDDLRLAMDAAERAAGLTRQLLAFSRRQTRAAESVNIAAVVRDVLPLLRSSLPPSIVVQVDLSAPDACVLADRSQMEQVVLNLVLNARDAMPDGGRLSVSVWVDHAEKHAMLAIADTGVGMTSDTKARIFEPFFTTKPLGRGTGLGLAVVYGVVTQAGGTVRAESALGQGTTMRILMPLHVDESSTPASTEEWAQSAPRTVLLVDDDDGVRSTTRRLLERHHWFVVEAKDGGEALDRFRADGALFAVVLTDIRMPHMDGLELARQIRALDPQCPMMFFSGYDEMEKGDLSGIDDIPLLAKPYTVAELLAGLHTVIGIREARGHATNQ